MPEQANPGSERSVLGCLLHFLWLVVGTMVLFFASVTMAQGPPWSFSSPHILFLATAALMVAVRFLDIRFFGGLTFHDEPATMRHWRRYSVSVVLAAGGLWILANVLAAVTRAR